MALVFADESKAELISMRCSSCRTVKPMDGFPPSCAIYRRGCCRECSAVKTAERTRDLISRKLQSARVRYRGLGGLRAKHVLDLYLKEGLDPSNEDHLRRTCLVKLSEAAPFGCDNAKLRWRAPLREAVMC